MIGVDPLTGLPGREALDATMANLRGTEYSVLFMDLDGLKEVNDRDGHRAGDELIRRGAEALRAVVRESDLVVRLGGDEFLAVLPGAGEGVATAVARATQTTLRLRGVSASIGAATAQLDEEPQAVCDRADAEMYRRKGSRTERRQVQAAVEEMAEEMIGGGVRIAEAGELPMVQAFVDQRLGGTVIPLAVRRNWYETFPRSLWVLADAEGVQGVFMYLPLRLETIAGLKDGTMAEKDIRSSDLDPGGLGAHVVVLAAAGPKEGALLVLRASRELSPYRMVTALTDTEAGAALCRRLHFQETWERGPQRFYELQMGR